MRVAQVAIYLLGIDETLTLQIPKEGSVEAKVKWAVDGKIGMRFLLGGSATEDLRARLGV